MSFNVTFMRWARSSASCSGTDKAAKALSPEMFPLSDVFGRMCARGPSHTRTSDPVLYGNLKFSMTPGHRRHLTWIKRMFDDECSMQ